MSQANSESDSNQKETETSEFPGTDAVWWQETKDLDYGSRWRKVTKAADSFGWTFDQVRNSWEFTFSDYDSEKSGPLPCWFPEFRFSDDSAKKTESNVCAFAAKKGLTDFQEIHRWSVEHPSEFWKEMIDHLQIKFNKDPESILDNGDGFGNETWLTGAELNITDNCFHEDRLDQTAIVFQRIRQPILQWSYRTLLENVQQVTAALHASGLAGKRIGIFMPMTPWCVAIYLGVIRAGGTIVSIADSFAAPEIAKRMEITQAEALFTYDYLHRGGKKFPLVERVHEAGPWKSIVLSCEKVAGGTAERLREGDLQFDRWLQEGLGHATESTKVSVNHPLNILFSSGTTGDPKAIPWDHSTPIKCAVDGFFHQDIQPGDVVAWPTNLGWMMGPWLIYATLLNKGTIALYGDLPGGKAFGRFVQDSGINVFGLVPSMVKSWRKSGCMERFDWSGIKLFSSTGESSDKEDYFYLSFLAGFKPIIEYCGGTEIGGGYVSSTVDRPNAPSFFSGPAIGQKFYLLDNDEEASDEGEVFLTSPSIGLSRTLLNRDHYKTYHEGTPAGPGGEPLRRHGDHFRLLPAGYYAAGGRVDDTMNLGGIKISSVELEAVLNQADGILESAAVAFQEESGPSGLCVFAVADPEMSINEEATLDQMNELLKKQLNPLFRVSQLRLVEKLPRTASNKIMRRLLRDQI